MKIGIGIATRGRPSVLADTLNDLQFQRRAPDRVMVAYAEPKDIEGAVSNIPELSFVPAELGLTRQRNAILTSSGDLDVLVFIDDDFYLHPDYLLLVERLFQSRPDVVVATGKVLLDGINGPGLTYESAKSVIGSTTLPANNEICPVFNAYGCNMCVRIDPIARYDLRFDEQLPLYGWYEDVDFSRQLAPHGSIVRIENAVGVHLGVKSGRTSGVRLGYSQVANPIYLMCKGTFPRTHMLSSILLRFSKNIFKSFSPEPYVDRRGRLRGNLLGLYDLVTRRLCPNRILSL